MNLLTIYAVSLLHVFKIGPSTDDSGNPIVLSSATSGQGISDIITFPRHFRPRFEGAENLIRDNTPDTGDEEHL